MTAESKFSEKSISLQYIVRFLKRILVLYLAWQTLQYKRKVISRIHEFKRDGFICRYGIDLSSHKKPPLKTFTCAYIETCTRYNDLLGTLPYTITYVLGSRGRGFIDLTFSFDFKWPIKKLLHAPNNTFLCHVICCSNIWMWITFKNIHCKPMCIMRCLTFNLLYI